MKAIKLAIALLCIALGVVTAIVGVVGIIDPVGTKMADDGDPFGDPGSPLAYWIWCSVGVVLCGAGARYLLRR